MTLTLFQRRLILIGFIIIFLVGAPAILISATGFRYQFKKRVWQPTGSFVIASQPSGAAILLNQQQTHYTTPSRILELLPGEYEVEIKKEEYLPWRKKLLVQPGFTTFAEHIILFRPASSTIISQLPANLLAPDRAIWSQDKKLLLYYNDHEIWLLRFNFDQPEKSEKELIMRYSAPVQNVFFHPSYGYLIVQIAETVKIIELDNRGQRNIIDFIRLKPEEKLLGISADGKELYYQNQAKQIIYQIKLY